LDFSHFLLIPVTHSMSIVGILLLTSLFI
jgi:hypothetical protein